VTPEKQCQPRSPLAIILILIATVIALPFVVIFLIVLEHVAFRTQFFSNGLEAIGLTKVLQALFTALGING
jgi:hypothetical protein